MDIKSGEVLGEVPVGVEPEGMTVSADDRYTVATSESTSMAHIIDNSTHELVGNILVDSRPREAKFSPDNKELWVSSEIGGTISVIDQQLGRPEELEGGEGDRLRGARRAPRAAAACGHGLHLGRQVPLRVPLGPANRVAVIDTATKEVKDYILVGQRPWHGEFGPDGKKYYVANGLTNDLDDHRRREPEGGEVRPGRTPALGRRHHALASRMRGSQNFLM